MPKLYLHFDGMQHYTGLFFNDGDDVCAYCSGHEESLVLIQVAKCDLVLYIWVNSSIYIFLIFGFSTVFFSIHGLFILRVGLLIPP